MESLSQVAIFEEKLALTPSDLRGDIPEDGGFDAILLNKMKVALEGKCSKHGFVIPGTLEILSRSMGTVEKGRFTSDFLFYLKAQGKVYNPPEGIQVEGDVIRKNKMGLYVIIENAIRIMIPRDLHIGNEEFDDISIGDRIRIEIKKSRFQVNDTHILSIGQFIGTSASAGAGAGAGAAEAAVVGAGAGEDVNSKESVYIRAGGGARPPSDEVVDAEDANESEDEDE